MTEFDFVSLGVWFALGGVLITTSCIGYRAVQRRSQNEGFSMDDSD